MFTTTMMFVEAISFAVVFALLTAVLFDLFDDLQHFDNEENKDVR